MKQTRWMMLGAVAAAAMFTTGCAGVGLLLARQTAQLQNTPTEPEPVAPAAQTAEAQPEPTLPVAIWDPQALQLSSQNGLYVLENPFDGSFRASSREMCTVALAFSRCFIQAPSMAFCWP